MIGVNSFCSKKAWLGGVQKRARAGYWYSSKKPYKRTMDYPIDDNNANNKIECRRASNLFGSSAYLPGDRGSLVLGGRIFDQKLDFGTTIRYNKGHQDRSVTDKNGFPNTAYVADWPKYIIYDIYASYKATNNLILRGTIENITNRAYLINYGDSLSMTPNRGRTIQGAIEYSF